MDESRPCLLRAVVAFAGSSTTGARRPPVRGGVAALSAAADQGHAFDLALARR